MAEDEETENGEKSDAVYHDYDLDKDDENDGDISDEEELPEQMLANSYFEDDELRFIEKNYGDSVSFMLVHGLKFYNPEDGEEAQAIVRAFMATDNDGDDENEHDDGNKETGEDDDEDDDYVSDFDSDHPEQVLANSYFEVEERRFINKYYGDTITFMLVHGFKFYNVEDGKKAQEVVQELMQLHNTNPSGGKTAR